MTTDVMTKVPVREQDAKVRATNFEEVCYGYNEEEAVCEANEVTKGKVKIAFASADLISGTGDAIKLNFNTVSAGKTEICITVNQMYNVLPDEYPIYLGDSYTSEFWFDIESDTNENDNPGSDLPTVDNPSEEIEPEKCDVSEDGVVSVSDLTSLISMIENPEKATPSGDINGDGKVDSKDVLSLVKLLLK